MHSYRLFSSHMQKNKNKIQWYLVDSIYWLFTIFPTFPYFLRNSQFFQSFNNLLYFYWLFLTCLWFSKTFRLSKHVNPCNSFSQPLSTFLVFSLYFVFLSEGEALLTLLVCYLVEASTCVGQLITAFPPPPPPPPAHPPLLFSPL